MRWTFITAVVLLSVASSVAQTPEDAAPVKPKKQPPPGTLHAITIKGNHLYPSGAIAKETGLKIGQRVTGPIIEEARKKLQASELFNDVSDEYHFGSGVVPAYDLTFEVAENQQLFPMAFERFGVAPDVIRSCLRDHVDLYSDQIPGTEGILHRYTMAVRECLAPTQPDVKVKAVISNDNPQQLTVLFSPDTPAPTISQVLVSGNQAVDTGTILRAVNQVAIGAPLSDTRLKMILDGTIKPLYAAKGYAAVTFPKVDTEPAKSNLGVVVKVQINDGPSFKFGAIRFHGSGMDEDEIRSSIPFKTGQPFNGEQVDTFRLSMLHRMKRRGLLDASISTQTEPDDSKRAVSVIYNVTPGGTYNFEKLDIQGLDITSEPAISKLWGEKPGHPFNPDYPEFFLKKVREQGIFDNLGDTQSDYTADTSSHNVTVHLHFKGGKSLQQREKDKKDARDRNQTDGTWSPYP